MIESYSFGRIKVGGKVYKRDIIIAGERIIEWWRKQGHKVCLDDVKVILEEKPEIVIFGTGAFGVMEVLPEVIEEFGRLGIEVIVLKTHQAVEKFNEIYGKRKVIGAFHLTC